VLPKGTVEQGEDFKQTALREVLEEASAKVSIMKYIGKSEYTFTVPEDVVEMFKEFDRKEAAYRLRTYRHKAYYSLDRNDGIEHEALFVAFSPYELYERKVTIQELYTAISRLPDKQAKRIYAHFILGLTKQDIARAEGVDEKVVRLAIERGLRNLEKILKKFL
jgi:RNA polymerase sigma-70 factor (ECF subfamily)